MPRVLVSLLQKIPTLEILDSELGMIGSNYRYALDFEQIWLIMHSSKLLIKLVYARFISLPSRLFILQLS